MLDDLYRHLHLGLILRTAGTRRQYYHAIMLRPLLITWIQFRIVTAGFIHCCFQIVANSDFVAATKEIDRSGMACQLVEPRLPPTCLGISVVGSAKRAEKHLRLTHLVGLRIVHRNGATTEINKAFVAGLMSLAH